jgi:hypothetical protein
VLGAYVATTHLAPNLFPSVAWRGVCVGAPTGLFTLYRALLGIFNVDFLCELFCSDSAHKKVQDTHGSMRDQSKLALDGSPSLCLYSPRDVVGRHARARGDRRALLIRFDDAEPKRRQVMTKSASIVTTRTIYFFLTAAVIVFVSMLLLTGLHP